MSEKRVPLCGAREKRRNCPARNLKVPPTAVVADRRLSPPPETWGGWQRGWGRAGGGPWRVWGHWVPGVELLAVEESPHVVVAHEVAAAHRARTLIRHEAPLDLKFRAHSQAQHGGRLPGHPEQQQEQRPAPPAPGPERHRAAWTREARGKAGRAAAMQTWKGLPASPGPQRPPPAARVRPLPGREEEPRPARGASTRRDSGVWEFLCSPRLQELREDRSTARPRA